MATAHPHHFQTRQRAPLRLLALTIALLLPLSQHASASKDFRDRSVIGNWKLVSVLDLASIASLDEAEAKTLLGKTLAITETAVKVDQEVCSAPEFWAERVVPEPHMREKLHSTAERLRLPNPATMVELGCTDVYIRNPGQLVLLWGGAMFDAVRIDPARRPQPATLVAAKRPLAKPEPGKDQKTAEIQKTGKAISSDGVRTAGSVQKTGKARKTGADPASGKIRAAGKVRMPAQPPRRKTGSKAPGRFANELF